MQALTMKTDCTPVDSRRSKLRARKQMLDRKLARIQAAVESEELKLAGLLHELRRDSKRGRA
jgi:hypothetical protein